MSESIYGSCGKGAWKLALLGITYINNLIFVQDPTGKIFYAGLLMFSLNMLYDYSALASDKDRTRLIRQVGFWGSLIAFIVGFFAFIIVFKYDNLEIQNLAMNFNRYWFCGAGALYLCVIAIDIFYCFFSGINKDSKCTTSHTEAVN